MRAPMRFQVLPGFRDFFPEDLAVRRWIESAWHARFARGRLPGVRRPGARGARALHRQVRATRSSGQLYTFVDKGGRAVALRPEMTPTLARMMAARGGGLPKPDQVVLRARVLPLREAAARPAARVLPVERRRDRQRRAGRGRGGDRGRARRAAPARARRATTCACTSTTGASLARTLRRARRGAERGRRSVLAIIDKLERDREARERLEAKLLGASARRRCSATCDAFPLDARRELAAVLDACARVRSRRDLVSPTSGSCAGSRTTPGRCGRSSTAARELRAVAGGGRYDSADPVAGRAGPVRARLRHGRRGARRAARGEEARAARHRRVSTSRCCR